MRWRLSNRFDSRALPLADRHYNRRKVGSPQFVPPGGCAVLLTDAADALWVTSTPFPQYVRHAWPGAWVNSLFRNESACRSSELIREAVSDREQTRRKRDPGRCYLRAGWEYAGHHEVNEWCPACTGRYASKGEPLSWPCGLTRGGLIVMRLPAAAFPAPKQPLPEWTSNGNLFEASA